MKQTETGLPPIAIRNQRVQKAVACEVPDRVPFIPTMGNFYATGYGITIQDAMTDISVITDAVDRFLQQYDPDLVYTPDFFPIEPMEFAGHSDARWPGEHFNLPPNTPYQYIDNQYLQDDDWDEYLKDPSAFLIKKMLARRYKAFEGLQHLDIAALCGQAIYSLAGLAAPPVKEALENMIRAAELTMTHLQKSIDIDMHILGRGYPLVNAAVFVQPFDEFAGNIRGLLQTTMDLVTDPEKINEAVARWADITIPSFIERTKMTHAEYAFIPLHCGMDTFMSPENYDRYYWPQLKRTIEELTAIDVVPFIFCEGAYNTRLETLTDIPKGKVIYSFEDVDLKRAKEILGGTACIAGGMPTQFLMKDEGSKQKVEDQVKKVLDDCAPGGGFVMSNSISLDNVEHELMAIWREVVDRYGCY